MASSFRSFFLSFDLNEFSGRLSACFEETSV